MGSITQKVTVLGATGNQGGSVVRSLLKNPDFQVRALTRSPGSERSKALSDLGAEIVQADGFDADQTYAAFQGSWGAFVNINSDDKVFTDPTGPTEFDMGKTIVDSAIKAGVKHLVFSSGPPCTELTGGKVSMRAMDMKYRIEEYARSTGKFDTLTGISPGWYMENFLSKEVAPAFGGFPHIPDSEGYLTFRVPKWGGKEDIPWLSITDDFGDIVHGIFLDPTRWNNQFIPVLSDIQSFDEMVASASAVIGKKTRYQPIEPSWEAFDTQGIHELEDVKLMFGFTQVTGGRYFGHSPTENDTAAELKREVAQAVGQKAEDGKLTTIAEWFKAHFVS